MSEHSYLSKLKFDPILNKSWIAKYLTNIRLVILVTLMVIILGIYAFANLPRNLNPEINIPIIVVSTVLPGAGPKDIESLITIPIEDAVATVENIKKITSSSRDSASIVTIEFDSGVNADIAKDKVQSAVDSITDLPEDALDSRVMKIDFENQPVWEFSIIGEDLPSLMRFGRELESKIKSLAVVESVSVSGLETQEIQINIKPEVITTYSINPLQLSQSVKSALSSFPAGAVRTSSSVFSLTIDPIVLEVEDIRKLVINLNGNPVVFSEIATIETRSKPDQSQSFLASGEQSAIRAITFSVFRNKNETINKAVEVTEKEVHQVIKASGERFKIYSILNTGEAITEQFSELQRDFILTTVLVFIVLFIFLGVRQAIMASFSAPLTFFISFTVMLLTGISLSFISLFSLLLSLGLLVDDTIVVISAVTQYYRTKKFTPLQTALLVWKDFLIAIFTTTITTVWAFIPLLLSTGIIGEFIKPIPIVVSTTLMGSFFVAMFITLPFLVVLLKPNVPKRVLRAFRILVFIAITALFIFLIPKNNSIFLLQILAFLIFIFVANITKSQLINQFKLKFLKGRKINLQSRIDYGFISFERISEKYKSVIFKIVSSRSGRIQVLIAVIIFSLLSYLLLPLGFVKNEFFPSADSEYIFVNLEMPSGSHISIVKTEALQVLDNLRKEDGVEFVTMDLGRAAPSSSGFGGGEGGGNLALFSIRLKDKGERKLQSFEIAQDLRDEYINYQKGTFLVQEQSGGPPAGADLQIKLFGNNLSELDKYANKISEYLKTQRGVTNIEKSIKPGTSKLVFVPDKEKLVSNNLGVETVGFWLRLFSSGFNTDEIKIEDENNTNRDITIRLSSKTSYIENLTNIQIPTPSGPIPISSLGDIRLEPNPTLISREDGKRTISVTAALEEGEVITEKNKDLEGFADNLNLPNGYSWLTGGVNEENNRSVQSIIQAMGLSFLLIIITMVLQFSSFRKSFIVMLVIPLSISGVFIIFALSNTPLSFPALIGVLALFGIVVKNSILVVDKITQNEKMGISFESAIADGAASRLEAIALTTICTIAGLIPITLSDPIWRGLGGAIIAGLTFSGTIMLFFIPVVYWYMFRRESKD